MRNRFLSVLLSVSLCISLCAVFTPKAYAATSYNTEKNYDGHHNGIVDRMNTATVSSELDSSFSSTINVVKITPNPTGNPEKFISLDHYSLSSLNLSLDTLKYISVYCKYEGETELDKALLSVMPHNGKYLNETVTVYSNETIKKGKWQWLNFDVGSAAYGKVTGNTLYQYHLYPYGEVRCKNLTASDIMKIGKVRYISYDKAAATVTGVYPMSFTGARENVTGTDPETVYLSVGDTFTLPQNPYSRPNHKFVGWICSADTQIYQPGDTYTVTERTRVGASMLRNITGEAVFYPDWEIIETKTTLPDVYSAAYTDYYNGMLGSKDYFSATKNYTFGGRKTVKLEILPASSNVLVLDGWQWNNIPFDLDKYNYVTITYYLDTDKYVSGTPLMNVLTSGGALTKATMLTCDRALETNKWAVMGFDLSQLRQIFSSDTDSHILKQFHLYFTGHTNSHSDKIPASYFNEGDAIYMDTLTLYTEKPDGDFRVQQGIMTGDGNGSIRPYDTLTRAEAATVILNVMGNEGKITKMPDRYEMTFSDVSPSDWYYYAVMAMDSFGYVPEDGLFRPNDPITVAEFMRFLFFIENDGMHEASFTAGEENTKPITRAQAAMLLSDMLTNGIPEQLSGLKVKLFDDLDCSSPEYSAFMNIAATRLSSFDESGNETVYQLLCPGSASNTLEYSTADGDALIKELNLYETQRIEEIRNTESEYAAKSYGNVYYLSSSEGTADGGSSAEAPKLITKLSEVTSMSLKNGDVVLFKRGDIFRGNFTTTAGVTYSAYGEGEKPKLYRSEKNHTGSGNWTLHYEDTSTGKKIWKTAYTVSSDVGAIVINGGEIVGLKEIPSYLSGKYYVRGQESVKEFVLIDELDRNLEFFHDLGGTNTTASGYVYFRCDDGNPGELYEDIEMNQKTNLIRAVSNVTVDNLCLMYFGSHGIGAGTVSNLTVTNCEIGFGGGSVQHYNTTGTVTRFGNGVEIYGGLVNFTIDNNYVYQIYDAGITHQISSTSAGNYYMKNVVYSNNVLCDSTYNIEYFMSLDDASTTSERFMENVLFENNLIRRAGYGWGQQRPDSAPAGIKGWGHNNYAVNTILRGNIIDRCYNHTGGYSHLIQLGTKYNGSTAYLDGNTFIQVPDRYFAMNHQKNYRYNHSVKDYIDIIGGSNNKVYYASEDNGEDGMVA